VITQKPLDGNPIDRSLTGIETPLALVSADTLKAPGRAWQFLAQARARFGVDRWTLLSFGLPFLLYLLTLAPTIYNLDSAELTTAAATGGLMRATGYPLYLSIGYLWSHLPVGDVGYRMNLFSAFTGALTLALAAQILRRMQVDGWAVLAGLGLLATGTYFWGLSLIAEVYTLHTALMAGLILTLLVWGESPSPRRLGLVALLTGLGLAHHAAFVLLLPGLAWYLFAIAPRAVWQPRAMLFAAGGLLLGLSFYLYLPLRYAAAPAFNYAGSYDPNLVFHPVDLSTPAGIGWLVTGRAFAGQMFAYPGAELWREIWNFIRQLSQAFFVAGLGPGLLGLFVLARREPRKAGMLGLMFLASAAFYINYRVLDKATMYLPAYLVWAVWVGYGLQQLLDWLEQPGTGRDGSRSAALLRGAMLTAVLFAAAWNWRLVDLSGDWSARERGESILQEVEAGALVFGWWDTVPVLQYLQLVEGQRPDVQAINRFLISPADLERAIRKQLMERPVYIDSAPVEMFGMLNARPAGTVYRLFAENK
jgi:hypothetical protein